MRRIGHALVALLPGLGCAPRPSGSEPVARFGHVTAVIGSRPFVGRFGPDSVIAVYSPTGGQLQIAGAADGHWPAVRLVLRCAHRPVAGAYAVGTFQSPVHATVALGPAPWYRRLTRALRGIPAHHHEQDRFFVSDSGLPGRLELEILDWDAAVVRGRFAVTLRSLSRELETITTHGRFAGRLHVAPTALEPGSQRWGSGFDLNCSAAHRPLTGGAGSGAPAS